MRSFAILAAALVVMSTSPAAANTIDQSDLNVTPPTTPQVAQDPYDSGVTGQTFTPSLSEVGFVTFRYFNANPGPTPPSTDLEVQLFAGDDPSGAGTPIGTSGIVVYPGTAGLTDVEFDFASNTSISAGSVYTFIIRDLTGSDTNAALYEPSFNPYPSGNLVNYGAERTGSDTYFSEGTLGGTTVSAAPEPSTWALLLGGVGILGAMMRVAHARRREDELKSATA